MNRLDFLTKLRSRLEQGGLPQDEIEDALVYYEEMFFDAGLAHDEETAANLGDPEAIARDILIENGIHADGEPVFIMEEVSHPNVFDGINEDKEDASYRYGYTVSEADEIKAERTRTLVKIIIAAATSPIWAPILISVLSVIGALMIAAAAIVAALFAAGAALVISGVTGLLKVPPIALCMIGCGLIMLGLFGMTVKPVIGFFKNGFVDVVKKAWELIKGFINKGGEPQ